MWLVDRARTLPDPCKGFNNGSFLTNVLKASILTITQGSFIDKIAAVEVALCRLCRINSDGLGSLMA